MKSALIHTTVVLSVLLTSCGGGTGAPSEQANEPTTKVDEAAEMVEIFSKAEGTTLKMVDQFAVKESDIEQAGENSISTLEAVAPPSCNAPTRIADLVGGVDFQIYKFDSDHSADASAFGFSGSIGKKEMLFVQDFRRYKVVSCDGEDVKVGISLRNFIHVTSAKGKIGYTRLPGVAANVELNNAKATYVLKTVGFSIDGSVLAEGLQTAGDYTVENFSKLSATFANTLRLLNSNSQMQIQAVILP